jgi:hypothetical protein
MAGASAGTTSRPGPAGSRGAIFAALVLYHALILAGALLLIEGTLRGPTTWVYAGTFLFVVGVLIQAWVLVWAFRAARSGAPIWSRAPGPGGAPAPQFLCPTCGLKGPLQGRVCPRCHRPVARVR